MKILHFFFYLMIMVIMIPAVAQVCSAHTMFIQPSHFVVHQGKSSPFFFCYGHKVPFDDGIRAEKLQAVSVVSPDGNAAAVTIRNETSLHSYMVTYNAPGTWILTVQTTPGFYTVYEDKNGREHHVIKPLADVKDKADKILMSLFVKQYSKSYVACESPSRGKSPTAGLELELVPVNDLFSLKPGQTLELEVLQNGKPFEGDGVWSATYNGFSTQPEDLFFPATQVTGSRFSFVIEEPGRWFVRYSTSQKAPESEKEQYQELKLSTSLVFQVDNARKSIKEK